MMAESNSTHILRLLLVIGVVTLIVGILCVYITSIRRYLGVSRGNGWLLGLAFIAAAIGTGAYQGMRIHEAIPRLTFEKAFPSFACSGLTILFGLPLVTKIYRAWIGAYSTASEKLPGSPGIRAWLSPGNIILALLTSICAAYGFGYPFLGIFGLTLIVLLAYPIANTMTQNPIPPQSAAKQETLISERERVLSLLDAGKITAEESAELLNALAATVQQPERDTAAGGFPSTRSVPGHRMVLIGAALVLAGFFLPWFSVNPAAELARMTGQIGMSNLNNVAQQFSSQSGINIPTDQNNNGGFPGFPFKTPTVHISGGDVSHGLGWIVLIASLAVAILPYLDTALEPQTRRTINLLALSGGIVILLYLLAGSIRFLNVGIVLAIAGYLLEFAAVIRQPRLPAFQKGNAV